MSELPEVSATFLEPFTDETLAGDEMKDEMKDVDLGAGPSEQIPISDLRSLAGDHGRAVLRDRRRPRRTLTPCGRTVLEPQWSYPRRRHP